ELARAGLVEALQDCGAAGLASALAEMASSFGIDVHLDLVPLREEGMEPWEVMISESQERMVALVRPTMVDSVEQVLDRWELHPAPRGEVTPRGELRCFGEAAEVGATPARLLPDECPRYAPLREPRPAITVRELASPPKPERALLELIGSPNLVSREYVYRRYDQLVGSRTAPRPGLDAAGPRLRPMMRGLAPSLDVPGRRAR